LLYRDREPTLEIATVGRLWSFDGDGALPRLVFEAQRIRLAYLFDQGWLGEESCLFPPSSLSERTTLRLARQGAAVRMRRTVCGGA